MTQRQLFTYDEVEHVLEPGEYGTITEMIPAILSDGTLISHYRVSWQDGTFGFYSHKELDYICPLSEVL
jgi:hypothetical protein